MTHFSFFFNRSKILNSFVSELSFIFYLYWSFSNRKNRSFESIVLSNKSFNKNVCSVNKTFFFFFELSKSFINFFSMAPSFTNFSFLLKCQKNVRNNAHLFSPVVQGEEVQGIYIPTFSRAGRNTFLFVQSEMRGNMFKFPCLYFYFLIQFKFLYIIFDL